MKTQYATETPIQVNGAALNTWTHCLRGERAGMSILLLGQINDDAFNGAEIIRKLNGIKSLKLVSGSLLSHCFKDGVSESELAEFESKQGVFDLIIELKSTPLSLSHLPRVSTYLADRKMQDIAHEFGAPVLTNQTEPTTRLQTVSQNSRAKWLTYELGQSEATNALSVWAGVKGLLNVMAYLGMIDCALSRVGTVEPFVAYINQWVHANTTGVIRCESKIELNTIVAAGQVLATIKDAQNGTEQQVIAPITGMIIGKQDSRFVTVHSPLFHIASVAESFMQQKQSAQLHRNYYPKTSGESLPLQVPFVF